jgi:hypothetical protein
MNCLTCVKFRITDLHIRLLRICEFVKVGAKKAVPFLGTLTKAHLRVCSETVRYLESKECLGKVSVLVPAYIICSRVLLLFYNCHH